jgi:NarL family two-component system response regulator LiaR
MNIRILLIDDDPVVRTGLCAALEAESDLAVVGEADNGTRGISMAHKLRPDVVLTDLLLPDVNGVTVTQRIPALLPATQLVILTSVDDDEASVLRAVQGGAIGDVLKTSDVAELVPGQTDTRSKQLVIGPAAGDRSGVLRKWR